MTDVINITATRAQFNGGQFDTEFRYIRTASSAAKRSTLLAGPSLAFNFNDATGTASFKTDFIVWRFQCGSYVVAPPAWGPTLGLSISQPTTVSNTPTDIYL